MGGTWDPDPDGFLLRFFFNFLRGMRTSPPPPPLEWLPFPPLVAAGSGRIGVIGALIVLGVMGVIAEGIPDECYSRGDSQGLPR